MGPKKGGTKHIFQGMSAGKNQNGLASRGRETMKLQYRPLGVVKSMLEQVGVEVTYAYEDLVFIKDNHFLLQFGKLGEILFFYANIEMVDAELHPLFASIQALAGAQGITLIYRGRYRISPGEGETLSLQFIEDPEPR